MKIQTYNLNALFFLLHLIYKNSFFFCVLTQQGHGQTKLTVKSLDEIYQDLKYLESGFSNKDGPAK